LAVVQIIKTEAEIKGYSGVFGVANMLDGDTGAYTETASGRVLVNIKQLKKGAYDNLYNLRNTLEHEADPNSGHKGEKILREYRFMDHVKIYFSQAKTNDYNKSDDYNKYAIAYGYANRVINAKENGEIYEKKAIDIDALFVRFNNENKGRVMLIHNNSENNHNIFVYLNKVLYNENGTLWSKIENPRD
jgi:hypothetical protein